MTSVLEVLSVWRPRHCEVCQQRWGMWPRGTRLEVDGKKV